MSDHLAIEQAAAYLPDGWALEAFRRLAHERGDRNGDLREQPLSLSSLGVLYERNDDTDRQHASEGSARNGWVVHPGDLVVNPMWLFGGAVGVSDRRGAVSPDYRVYALAPRLDPRFVHHLLRSGPYLRQYRLYMRAETTFDRRITKDDFAEMPIIVPPPPVQRTIARYLDAEVAAMDGLLSRKRRLIDLLQERIDAEITEVIGQSAVIDGAHGSRVVPIHRQLEKLDRPPEPGAPVVTAFRDGQVTARMLRRAEGFTESWTDGARVQGVRRGDVVVHGLDGFAGAIGASEADGVCSPIYHVCTPIRGGDPDFYGRLLRVLATTGYLGNFATSTRERAVDFRNWDLFGRIPIPDVDVDVQRRLGNSIRQLAPIRERVARSQVLIDERREALVTTAVTGQLAIPGVAA